MTEGWMFALNWRKAHYVRGNTSLCRRWVYFGSTFLGGADASPSPDYCVACTKRLSKPPVRGTLASSAERHNSQGGEGSGP